MLTSTKEFFSREIFLTFYALPGAVRVFFFLQFLVRQRSAHLPLCENEALVRVTILMVTNMHLFSFF